MTEPMTQYRVRCDVPGCPRSTGARADANSAECEAVRVGWDCCRLGSEQNGTAVHLFRCPACIRAGKYPDNWSRV